MSLLAELNCNPPLPATKMPPLTGLGQKNAALSRDAIAKIDTAAAAARGLHRVRAEALPKLKGDLL